ncbi:hypothetical protein BHE74_00017669 [Ensete ventricosum]|uniref:Uncharacterized protein n=1 Tax=Ensete ventricosum TaxID=4639 RepID=A0A426YAZ1_ENSVE|nr:hypothetical protein B296_00052791 [Ensete ventricosum]RWW74400.1 hypothetical protein BHE74_00017669 [Ensete ventricosum]
MHALTCGVKGTSAGVVRWCERSERRSHPLKRGQTSRHVSLALAFSSRFLASLVVDLRELRTPEGKRKGEEAAEKCVGATVGLTFLSTLRAFGLFLHTATVILGGRQGAFEGEGSHFKRSDKDNFDEFRGFVRHAVWQLRRFARRRHLPPAPPLAVTPQVHIQLPRPLPCPGNPPFLLSFFIPYSSLSWSGFGAFPQQTNLDGHRDRNLVPAAGGDGEELDSARRRKQDENDSRSGSDNLEGGSEDDLEQENPRKKKRYHRHTPQQIQELEA